jgi:hypothetical protein
VILPNNTSYKETGKLAMRICSLIRRYAEKSGREVHQLLKLAGVHTTRISQVRAETCGNKRKSRKIFRLRILA